MSALGHDALHVIALADDEDADIGRGERRCHRPEICIRIHTHPESTDSAVTGSDPTIVLLVAPMAELCGSPVRVGRRTVR